MINIRKALLYWVKKERVAILLGSFVLICAFSLQVLSRAEKKYIILKRAPVISYNYNTESFDKYPDIEDFKINEVVRSSYEFVTINGVQYAYVKEDTDSRTNRGGYVKVSELKPYSTTQNEK